MSFTHGIKQIVSDGLVFYLDAANTRSYPGSGTSVIDMVNNTTTSLINGTSFSSTSPQYFDLDGVNDEIQVTSNSFTNLLNNWTIDCWFNADVISGPDYVTTVNPLWWKVATDNGNSDTFYMGLATTPAGNKIRTGLERASDDADFAMTSTTAISTGVWYNGIATYDNNTLRIYLNGSSDGSSTIGVATAYSGNSAGRIGSTLHTNHGTKGAFNGKISIFKLYNRALSSTEILQNYNVLKSRFGI